MSVKYIAYEKLATLLNQTLNQRINLMLVSLPGAGLSHYLKQFTEENSQKITYISSLVNTPILLELNIIDVSFLSNPDIYIQIDNLVLSAGVNQKFVVVIDDPSWLRSDAAKKSQFISRIYKTEYFPVHSEADSRAIALEKNPQIDKSWLTITIKLSSGFAKLIKYISLKSPSADGWWNQDEQLKTIIKPTLLAIHRCSDNDLAHLGLSTQSLLISGLIKSELKLNQFDIKFRPDLGILENSQDFSKKVSSIEKSILDIMLKNDGLITKEKIAEIKWGEGSYDNFSDQAIKKTMMRLSVKLKKYRIKSVTKVGYQLAIR